jgi:hypothetical protein
VIIIKAAPDPDLQNRTYRTSTGPVGSVSLVKSPNLRTGPMIRKANFLFLKERAYVDRFPLLRTSTNPLIASLSQDCRFQEGGSGRSPTISVGKACTCAIA